MSALVAAPAKKTTRPQEDGARAASLRPLATPSRRMARLPFLVVLIAAFGLGMAGLLMLNTTLQNQEFEARRLNSRASQLTYVQDDLESQLQTASSPASLAGRAYAQGMRPNAHPAFLVLPDGTVVGKAEPTEGKEMHFLQPGTGEQLTADRAAAEAAKKKAAAAAKAAAEAATTDAATTKAATTKAAGTNAAATKGAATTAAPAASPPSTTSR